MNKIRRKQLADLQSQIEDLRSQLEGLKDEEDEYRDNLPENMQGAYRYEISEEASNNMDAALLALEEACESIEEAMI